MVIFRFYSYNQKLNSPERCKEVFVTTLRKPLQNVPYSLIFITMMCVTPKTAYRAFK